MITCVGFINKQESHSHYIKMKFQLTIINKLKVIKKVAMEA